jgi:hypothetical protein
MQQLPTLELGCKKVNWDNLLSNCANPKICNDIFLSLFLPHAANVSSVWATSASLFFLFACIGLLKKKKDKILQEIF